MNLEITNFYPIKDAEQFRLLAIHLNSLAEPNYAATRFAVKTKPADHMDSGVWTVTLELDKRGISIELDGKPYFNVSAGGQRSAEDIIRIILTLKDAFMSPEPPKREFPIEDMHAFRKFWLQLRCLYPEKNPVDFDDGAWHPVTALVEELPGSVLSEWVELTFTPVASNPAITVTFRGQIMLCTPGDTAEKLLERVLKTAKRIPLPETEVKVVASVNSGRHVVSILEDGTITIKGDVLRIIAQNNADGFVNFLSEKVDDALDGITDEKE